MDSGTSSTAETLSQECDQHHTPTDQLLGGGGGSFPFLPCLFSFLFFFFFLFTFVFPCCVSEHAF